MFLQKEIWNVKKHQTYYLLVDLYIVHDNHQIHIVSCAWIFDWPLLDDILGYRSSPWIFSWIYFQIQFYNCFRSDIYDAFHRTNDTSIKRIHRIFIYRLLLRVSGDDFYVSSRHCWIHQKNSLDSKRDFLGTIRKRKKRQII